MRTAKRLLAKTANPQSNGRIHLDFSLAQPPARTITLADLPSGDPPAPLVPPFLTREGITVIYGKGGRLKGYTAIYLARELVRIYGFRVCILDFENHPWEWGSRSVAMGFTKVERASVDYLTPYGSYWPFKRRGSLKTISVDLRDYLEAHGCSFAIVDSYTTATDDGDAMGGAPAAKDFFTSFTKLGCPGLVLAHVAGGQERFPDKPFGSVFVHNLARETWAVELANDGDDELSVMGTTMATIELRNKKSNSGALQRPVLLTYAFHPDGSVVVGNATPELPKLSESIHFVLASAGIALTVKEIAAAIKSDDGRRVGETVLRNCLARHEGEFVRVAAAKGLTKWAVKP